MRQIILDTETTGISHEQGHKVIEIGCLELINRRLTGSHFHTYLNPGRAVDEGAFRVHGISTEFLTDKPLFKDVLTDFLDFIGTSELIIHNAPFDLGFLNSELRQAKWKGRLEDHCSIFDTLVLAREKHPGQRNSLDVLCKRYHVDNSNRQLHGALLDAELLALVYLAMTGGQTNLFAEEEALLNQSPAIMKEYTSLHLSNPVLIQANAEELKQHHDFVTLLKKNSKQSYFETEEVEDAT